MIPVAVMMSLRLRLSIPEIVRHFSSSGRIAGPDLGFLGRRTGKKESVAQVKGVSADRLPIIPSGTKSATAVIGRKKGLGESLHQTQLQSVRKHS